MNKLNEYINTYKMSLNGGYFKTKHFENLLPKSKLPVHKNRRIVELTNEDIANLELLSEILESKYQGKLTSARVIRVILKKVMDDLDLSININEIGNNHEI